MDNKHNDRRIFDLAMHTWLRYALVFLKWLLWAAVIGMALGFISTAFHYSVDFAQELRLACPWLLCLLPVGGLIIVFMYRVCGVKDDRGANAVLEATINGEPVKKRVAPLIFTGTVLTHLFGGSAGREGAALQLGGSIAGLFGGGALPFFALACAASYLLSGYSSLYGSQRIVLDKWHIGE